jgi:hypothetical protein
LDSMPIKIELVVLWLLFCGVDIILIKNCLFEMIPSILKDKRNNRIKMLLKISGLVFIIFAMIMSLIINAYYLFFT